MSIYEHINRLFLESMNDRNQIPSENDFNHLDKIIDEVSKLVLSGVPNEAVELVDKEYGVNLFDETVHRMIIPLMLLILVVKLIYLILV